jgi:hypothetical protein
MIFDISSGGCYAILRIPIGNLEEE